ITNVRCKEVVRRRRVALRVVTSRKVSDPILFFRTSALSPAVQHISMVQPTVLEIPEPGNTLGLDVLPFVFR
ncbi:hypothetical protein CPC08DRAFT_704489, partial [Agrocybe pediades]